PVAERPMQRQRLPVALLGRLRLAEAERGEADAVERRGLVPGLAELVEARQDLPVAGERRPDAAAGVEDQALVVAQIGLVVGEGEAAREAQAAGERLVGGGEVALLPENDSEVAPGHHLAFGPAELLPTRDHLAMQLDGPPLLAQAMRDLGQGGDRL